MDLKRLVIVAVKKVFTACPIKSNYQFINRIKIERKSLPFFAFIFHEFSMIMIPASRTIPVFLTWLILKAKFPFPFYIRIHNWKLNEKYKSSLLNYTSSNITFVTRNFIATPFFFTWSWTSSLKTGMGFVIFFSSLCLDFSMKLTESPDSDLNPKSGWNNNNCCESF